MGLRDDILNDLTPEMDGDLADVVELCSFDRVTGGGWNDNTDKPIPEIKTIYSGRGFYLSFNHQERQTMEILQGDVKFIILSNTVDTKPEISDKLTVKGELMTIVSQLDCPANVGYALQLRKYG